MNSRFNRIAISSAVCAIALCGIVAQKTKSKTQDYEAGMNSFYKGDYPAAKTSFSKAIIDAPKDAAAHFALGNTLTILRDQPNAAKEYQAAFDNADTEEMKGNAKAALLKLNAKNTPRNTMMRQVYEHSTSVSQQTENQQKSILEAAKSQAERIKNDHYVDPNYYRRRGYAEQMKAEGNAQAEAVLKRAQQQAADYKHYVDEKNAALNDVSNNLDDQMNQSAAPGKIHLKKEGTNLNVRNYEFNH
jgi:lysyl-tRNA synthetase class I